MEAITFVGLDVHKRMTSVAIAEPGREREFIGVSGQGGCGGAQIRRTVGGAATPLRARTRSNPGLPTRGRSQRPRRRSVGRAQDDPSLRHVLLGMVLIATIPSAETRGYTICAMDSACHNPAPLRILCLRHCTNSVA
jgi:hypothetical protein